MTVWMNFDYPLVQLHFDIPYFRSMALFYVRLESNIYHYNNYEI